jgi:hypothetical protein
LATDDIVLQINEQNNLSGKLDAVKSRLESRGFQPTMVMECCIIQNVIACKFSPLHWLHPKAWHSIRVVAASSALLLMKNKGLHQTDPSVVAMLQLAGKCQLDHFLWLKRSISMAHGRVEIRTSCQNLDPPNMLKEKSFATRDKIEVLLDSIISGEESALNNNSQLASLVFHAGLDLLLAGHNERVALLFERFQDLFCRWRILSDDNQTKIQTLVESKGRLNRFTNHMLF